MIPLYYEIAIPCPLPKTFDYLPPESGETIQPGMRVLVPFGKREVVGFCLSQKSKTDVPFDKLKQISHVLDTKPLLPDRLLTFFNQISQYYHHAIGDVIVTGLPSLFRQAKPCELQEINSQTLPPIQTIQTPSLTLTAPQQNAILTFEKSFNQAHNYLLKGVTGSGKTEVYLQIIQKLVQAGYQALVLVPEIALTPQTLSRFQERFGEWVYPYHSQLTPKLRKKTWLATREGLARIIVGTRSALFLPFSHLKIIIVDEEHDPSFKQQEGFKYFARDMAVLRGQHEKFPVLLGSATPSLETIHNVRKGKYQLLELPERANSACLPTVTCLDVRHKKFIGGLSNQLIHEILQTLKRGEQVLLFLNRRGYSPAFMCFDCGWLAQCHRCETRLTFHQAQNRLICHHCEATHTCYAKCPECGAAKLQPLGSGTERIEEAIQEIFPEFSILRIDSDSTRTKGSFQASLDKIHTNDPMILIGTQMLAKGHHFPNVTLVAIIDADSGLFSTDFRAIERMGQQIIQVSGRAGRGTKPGKVIIQTFHPNHPMMEVLLYKGYWEFAQLLLQERQKTNLPPYSFLALFRAESTKSEYANSFLENLAQLTKQKIQQKNIVALGPVPAPLARKSGKYRYQLLLNANTRNELQSLLKIILRLIPTISNHNRIRWSLDVDPIDLV